MIIVMKLRTKISLEQYVIVRDNMTKIIVSVSKKDNSVWRLYYYDVDEYDNTLKFYAKKINPLLVWFYKLKKQKLCNNVCDICGNEFKFYKSRFESMSSMCINCDPELDDYTVIENKNEPDNTFLKEIVSNGLGLLLKKYTKQET